MKLPKLPLKTPTAADVQQNRRRSLKYGAYTTLLAVLLLAVLILVNLVVAALPTRYTAYDISISGMFTLTDTTQRLLAELDRDVTAYYLGITGEEDPNITRILDRYADESPHFTWQQRDPNLYPTFAQQYGAQAANIGSVILVCGDRSTLVDAGTIYLADYSYYYIDGTYTLSFDAENALTGGIATVLRAADWPLYQLTGHGEMSLGSDYAKTLASIGVAVQELNLVTAGTVPADAAVLLIAAPQVDYTQENIALLRGWLQNGGRMLVCTDAYIDTPNLDALLAEYGLSREPGLVIETNPEYYAYNNPPAYLLPEVQANEITAGMTANMFVFAPFSQGIVTDTASEFAATPLLTTTAQAYSMVDFLTGELTGQGPDDPNGPFDLAVAVEGGAQNARLVWVNCPYILDGAADDAVYGGNAQFVGSVVNWLNGQEPATVIAAKSMSGVLLNVPLGTAVPLALLFVLIVPVGLIIAGVVTCLLRRRR